MGDGSDDGVIGHYEYLRYDHLSEVYRPYDARFPAVACQVTDLIRGRMPDAQVEHVGSTAVPGCAGKGIVDLLLMYSPGRLAVARDALNGLGFQRQVSRDPFPEERPMRVGALERDDTIFRLHVHVVAADSPEVADLLRFRDRLRADPALAADYVALKQAILTTGVTDGVDYNCRKEPFIQAVLRDTAAAGSAWESAGGRPDPA